MSQLKRLDRKVQVVIQECTALFVRELRPDELADCVGDPKIGFVVVFDCKITDTNSRFLIVEAVKIIREVFKKRVARFTEPDWQIIWSQLRLSPEHQDIVIYSVPRTPKEQASMMRSVRGSLQLGGSELYWLSPKGKEKAEDDHRCEAVVETMRRTRIEKEFS
jgi:hypothetical protein